MSELPKVGLADVPAVSAAEMAEVDRLATDEFGVGRVPAGDGRRRGGLSAAPTGPDATATASG